MKDPSPTFEERLRSVHENETLLEALRITNIGAFFVTVYAFFYLMVSLYFSDVTLGLCATAVLAVPLVLVSLLRYIIKAPRPFELFDFYGDKIKRRRGHSFPSRHAYSAFAIGTLLCFFNLLFGLLVLALAAAMSISRVLLGYHFPRDVIAGGCIGVVASVIGYFLLIM